MAALDTWIQYMTSTNKRPLHETQFVVRRGREDLEEIGMLGPRNNGTQGQADVKVYFRDIQASLIERIEKYPAVVGCMAWLTDFKIIDALSSHGRHVAIIMQKEDFLRPDDEGSDWSARIRAAYSKVPCRFWISGMPSDTSLSYHYGKMAVLAYPENDLWGHVDTFHLSPFRCAGPRKNDQETSAVRMHNKFLVFCDIDEDGNYLPAEVWTGSYNASYSATLSFENVLAIKSDEIARAYLNEFSDIALLSEPLDWTTVWMRPQYAIGVS